MKPHMENCDAVIVGAGPYGLSAAAYLRKIEGLDLRVFGQPMCFWERCMPQDMLLRSHWNATHLAAPQQRLTLNEYVSDTGNPGLSEPIPNCEFIRYGRWFHDRAGVDADFRKVMRIEQNGARLRVSLEDGASVLSRRVIVATGIESHAYRPETFRQLPRQLASHSSELRSFSAFKDKEVIVIGGGQSALESAAFLHQAGAHVEIFVRGQSACVRPRLAPLRRLIDPKNLTFLYGRGGVGAAGISRIIQQPHLYARFSPQFRTKWDRKSTKLGFSYRLVPAMNGTPIRYEHAVQRAAARNGRVVLRLTDGSERAADHVVLATGYCLDISRTPFLCRSLLDRLTVAGGHPVLNSGLESSVPGLHFLGAAAAYTFGPLLRFVAGTEFASSAVARGISRVEKAN